MATRALLYRRPARTLNSRGYPRLAILFDQAPPAPARARRFLRCASIRPTVRRSSPCRRADRSWRRASLRRCARWLDRRPSRPLAEGGAVPARHRDPAAGRAAPDRAPCRRARHGVDRDARQRRENPLRCRVILISPTAACMTSSSARRATCYGEGCPRICRGTRRAGAPRSIRDQLSRWGFCAWSGRRCRFPGGSSWRRPWVCSTISPPRVNLARLVEMNHSPRFWRVVDRIGYHVDRAKRWLDTHGNDRTATGSRIRSGATPKGLSSPAKGGEPGICRDVCDSDQ